MPQKKAPKPTPPKKTPKPPAKPTKLSKPKKDTASSDKKPKNSKEAPRSNKIKPPNKPPKNSNSQPNLSGIQNFSQSLEQVQAYTEKAKELGNFISDKAKQITGASLSSQLERAKSIDALFSPTKEPDTYRLNYIPANHFYIEMDGQVKASFKEFSGIGVNIKKESYLEGGVNDQQRVMLGHAEFSDITLKRGMTDDGIFLTWVMQTLMGKPKNRRNINILLFNQAGETMQCYTLIGAIPISWKSPGFQADGNSVAIEELTLSYEGLNVLSKTPGGGPTLNINRDSLGFFPDK